MPAQPSPGGHGIDNEENRLMHVKPSTIAPEAQEETHDFYRLDLTMMAGWSDAAKEQYVDALAQVYRAHLQKRVIESEIKARENIINKQKPRGRN